VSYTVSVPSYNLGNVYISMHYRAMSKYGQIIFCQEIACDTKHFVMLEITSVSILRTVL